MGTRLRRFAQQPETRASGLRGRAPHAADRANAAAGRRRDRDVLNLRHQRPPGFRLTRDVAMRVAARSAVKRRTVRFCASKSRRLQLARRE
jgi:hypothetical protein